MTSNADNQVGLDDASGNVTIPTAHNHEVFRSPDIFVDGIPYRLVAGSGSPTYEPIPARLLAGVPSAYWREGC